MRVPAAVTAVLRRMRHPRITVRGRLALLYGSVFLASGIALLAITYVLVDDAIRRFAGVPVPARGSLRNASWICTRCCWDRASPWA